MRAAAGCSGAAGGVDTALAAAQDASRSLIEQPDEVAEADGRAECPRG
ncbi:hypothetical protein [Streptomyces aureoverticillatus]